jgi:hypothetical protein
MFLNLVGNIFAYMETFEETSRITNVSATMFPSLPRALVS